MLPLASIVMVLLSTRTVQTPSVLLALAVVAAVQSTRRSAMTSAAGEGSRVTNLPWYCAVAIGSDGAAPTPFVAPHELKPSGFVDVGGFIEVNCPGGPARISTQSDCAPLL